MRRKRQIGSWNPKGLGWKQQIFEKPPTSYIKPLKIGRKPHVPKNASRILVTPLFETAEGKTPVQLDGFHVQTLLVPNLSILHPKNLTDGYWSTKHFRYLKWRNPHLYKLYIRLMQGKTHHQNSLTRFSTSILGTWNSWWLNHNIRLKELVCPSTLLGTNMAPENWWFPKRNLLFQGAIFRFHVKLWEGNSWLSSDLGFGKGHRK